jgi:hypothetical protein
MPTWKRLAMAVVAFECAALVGERSMRGFYSLLIENVYLRKEVPRDTDKH